MYRWAAHMSSQVVCLTDVNRGDTQRCDIPYCVPPIESTGRNPLYLYIYLHE